jgi:hypothetical protein
MTTKPSSTSNPGPLGEILAGCIEGGAKQSNPREAARRALACMLGRLSAALADDPDPANPGTAASDPATTAGEPAKAASP